VTFEFTFQHDSCYIVTSMDINLIFIIKLVVIVGEVVEQYMIVAVQHVACVCKFWCICKFIYHETLQCCMDTLFYCEHVTFKWRCIYMLHVKLRFLLINTAHSSKYSLIVCN